MKDDGATADSQSLLFRLAKHLLNIELHLKIELHVLAHTVADFLSHVLSICDLVNGGAETRA